MSNFLMVLLLVALIGLIVGLVKPATVRLKTRKSVAAVLGSSFVVLFILFGVATPTVPQSPKPKAQEPEIVAVNKPTESAPTEQPAETAPAENVAVTPAPVPAPKTLEQKTTDAIIAVLGEKTNMGKITVVEVNADKYNAAELKDYGYKPTDSVTGLLIKINSSENLTTNLQKSTMNKEAAQVFQAAFPLDPAIGDIVIWSRLPIKDKYGNLSDDTAIVYSMSRSLFDKVNWKNFYYNDLPALLKSEASADNMNSYWEAVKF